MATPCEFTIVERDRDPLPIFFVKTPDNKRLEFSMWEWNQVEQLCQSAGWEIVYTQENI